jgi:hypothetical protein
MYQTITQSQFIDIMNNTRPNQISYEGLTALFDFYEDIEDPDNQTEFDPIAIFCEWTEYDHISEVIEAYSDTFNADNYEDYSELINDLQNHTTVLAPDGTEGAILINNF